MLTAYFLIFSFIFGAIIGSFLNVLILRLPEDKSLGGRSHCPHCGRGLGFLDLIPILSFLALRGKCRSCSTQISARYLIIELTVSCLFALAFYWFSPVTLIGFLEVIRVWFIVCILVAVFVIDFEHFLILDVIVFPASVVLLLFNIGLDYLSGGFQNGLYGMTVGGVFSAVACSGVFFSMWAISKGRWIGFGDVKYMLFLGQIVGFPLTIIGFFLSFFIGALVAIPLMFTGKYSLASKLPLGTFLSIGFLSTFFYGQQMLNWYLGLIGLR